MRSGYDRPIWVNLLGPDPDTLKVLISEFAEKVAKVPGIADMETSEKAANPALSIRLNNDAAADLGHYRCSRSARPFARCSPARP